MSLFHVSEQCCLCLVKKNVTVIKLIVSQNVTNTFLPLELRVLCKRSLNAEVIDLQLGLCTRTM